MFSLRRPNVKDITTHEALFYTLKQWLIIHLGNGFKDQYSNHSITHSWSMARNCWDSMSQKRKRSRVVFWRRREDVNYSRVTESHTIQMLQIIIISIYFTHTTNPNINIAEVCRKMFITMN